MGATRLSRKLQKTLINANHAERVKLSSKREGKYSRIVRIMMSKFNSSEELMMRVSRGFPQEPAKASRAHS